MGKRPLSKAEPEPNPGCTRAFGIGFALVGLAFLVFFFLVPLVQGVSAENWTPTPCTITDARLDRGENSYFLQVEFSYEVDGRAYRSDRLQFGPGVGRSREGGAAALEELTPGSEQTCYVDPNDPSQAVLRPGPPEAMWFVLIPLGFIAAGIGIFVFSKKKEPTRLRFRETRRTRGHKEETRRRLVGRSSRSETSSLNEEFDVDEDDEFEHEAEAAARSKTFKPGSSRWKRFLGAFVLTIVWNGIMYFFAKAWIDGEMNTAGKVFLTPFLLFGAYLIVATPLEFLKVFNPLIEVTLTPVAPRLGESVDLSWVVHGRSSRLRALTLRLTGTATAAHGRGTSRTASSDTFHDEILVEEDRRPEIAHSQSNAAIPEDTMHTFRGRNNQIEWKLVVQGDIAFWPDVRDEYAITILPLRHERQVS